MDYYLFIEYEGKTIKIAKGTQEEIKRFYTQMALQHIMLIPFGIIEEPEGSQRVCDETFATWSPMDDPDFDPR